MTLATLPTEIIAHILSYVAPDGIVAICGGHIYPLKSILLAYKLHTTAPVIQYMCTHPSNNLHIRYNTDMSEKLPEPLFASRRRLCMPKAKQPQQIKTNTMQLQSLYQYANDNTYTTRTMSLVDIIAKNTIAAIESHVVCANIILRDCGIKLCLLNNIKIAEHVACVNKTVQLLRITYYHMRDTVAMCKCVCGRRLIYICRGAVNVDVMCATRASVIMRARAFTRRLHMRIVQYGRFAGQSFRAAYRQIAARRNYTGNLRYNSNIYTLNNYIMACFVRDTYAPMCPASA